MTWDLNAGVSPVRDALAKYLLCPNSWVHQVQLLYFFGQSNVINFFTSSSSAIDFPFSQTNNCGVYENFNLTFLIVSVNLLVSGKDLLPF